jgi:hypothetical protein
MSFLAGERGTFGEEREMRAGVPVGLVRPDAELYGEPTRMFGPISSGFRRTEKIAVDGHPGQPGERSRADRPA